MPELAHIPSREIVLDVLNSMHPYALDFEAIRSRSAYSGSNEQLDCILRGLYRAGHIKPIMNKWRFVSRRSPYDKRCKKKHDEPLNVDFELPWLLDAIRRVMKSATKTQRGVLIGSVSDYALLESAVAYYEDHGYR